MLPNKINNMVPVISDQKVEQIDFGRQTPPDNWRSRRLYIQQGAENWCNLAHHSNYPLQGDDPYDLKKNRSAALDRISISTILSLGPGDGLQDLDIVEQLRSKQPNLTYIPLDLSRILLELTNSPVMFSMLGGTVGNLDLGENHFFDRLLNLMKKDDRVLLDVPLAGPGWSPERDPRFNTEKYTTEFKQFIASGLSRLKPENNSLISFETARKRLDCVIGNGGDIAKTKEVKIIDRLSNEIILKFCRYDWESIISWLTNRGFDILYHRCSLKNDMDIFGMGIILLGLRLS